MIRLALTLSTLLGTVVLASAQTTMPPPAANSAATATAPAAGTATATADNALLLTVFLKHDQSRPLADLNAQLTKQGFYEQFPPAGVEVLNWYVVMGIGQIITLRMPASRIREVNRILEDTAWGSYRTEFFPTYDYKAVGMGQHEKAIAP